MLVLACAAQISKRGSVTCMLLLDAPIARLCSVADLYGALDLSPTILPHRLRQCETGGTRTLWGQSNRSRVPILLYYFYSVQTGLALTYCQLCLSSTSAYNNFAPKPLRYLQLNI